jgi:hypothetical protein
VNQPGSPRRSASGPRTYTAPDRRAAAQARSPRHTSTSRRRLAVTVALTSNPGSSPQTPASPDPMTVHQSRAFAAAPGT